MAYARVLILRPARVYSLYQLFLIKAAASVTAKVEGQAVGLIVTVSIA